MTDYYDIAVNDVRSYLWNAIETAGVLNENDYYVDSFSSSLVPIIPAQQVPEFNNLIPGKTYLIYDFDVMTIPVQWWMTEEMLTLTIVSQNYDKVNQIMSLIQDLFRRYDESASDINGYLAGNTTFQFHHTLIESVKSPEPYDEEGSFQVGLISVSYTYSRKTGSSGRF